MTQAASTVVSPVQLQFTGLDSHDNMVQDNKIAVFEEQGVNGCPANPVDTSNSIGITSGNQAADVRL